MAHYFDTDPQAEHQIRDIPARFHGIDFRFTTDSGVFSKTRLDYGTELLIETVIVDQPKMIGKLVDLGCGYGPVGIVLKRVYPALDITMCDINLRALTLARLNAKANQVAYLTILKSDILEAVEGPVDYILTNPPIRTGKQMVFDFYTQAHEKLKPGGLLFVVIQKKQGAPSSLVRLEELFSQAEVIEHSAGYWIIRAKK